MSDKIILDPCCGSRMFWHDRQNKNVVFADIRTEEHILCDGRALSINPDIEMDFTKMPYPDNSFYHVIFDPPHLNKLGKKSWMALKYGVLHPTWEMDIKEGFAECMRVLKVFGTLNFKWNESQITESKIIEVIGYKPLYSNRMGKSNRTIWMSFVKMPTIPTITNQ